MKCDIKLNPKDNSVEVKNKVLFAELLEYSGGDTNRALALYGVTLTPGFKSLGLKKAGIDELTKYITQYNIDTSKLSIEDELRLLDLGLNVETEDVVQSFIDTFDNNGSFGITPDTFTKNGLFRDIDYSDVVDDLSFYENLWYKAQSRGGVDIKKMDYDLVEKGQNPDTTLGRVINEYALYDNNILSRAVELDDTVVLDNIDVVESMLKNTSSHRVYYYNVDKNILEPTDITTKTILLNTLDLNKDLTVLQDYVGGLVVMMSEGTYDDMIFNEGLADVVNSLADLGVNPIGLYDLNSEDLQEYLDTLYNFLEDFNNSNSEVQESLDEYVRVHQDLLGSPMSQDITRRPRLLEYNRDNSDFMIEKSDFIQQELYDLYDLVQVAPNTYRKVARRELADIYTDILNNPVLLPKNEKVFTVEISPKNTDILVKELDNYITRKASEMYINQNNDINTLKEIVAHKIIELAVDPIYNGLQNNVKEDPSFEEDFYDLIIKDDRLNKIFYIDQGGIQSYNPIGEYTREYLKILLDTDTYSDLQNYALLSGNESLEGVLEDMVPDKEVTRDSKRLYYRSNITKLPNYRGDIKETSGAYVINSNKDFIRVGDKLLENVGNNVYKEVFDNTAPHFVEIDKVDVKPFSNIIEKPTGIVDNTIEFC